MTVRSALERHIETDPEYDKQGKRNKIEKLYK